MTDPLATINGNKLICTGVGLNYEKPPEFSSLRPTEASFDSLVSEYHTFFREAIAAEVAFLRSVEDHRQVANFEKIIYLLRTAKQHDDNTKAQAFYREWTKEHASWQTASDALAEALTQALAQLARVSARVRRDSALTQAWRARAYLQPETIFETACGDLNVSFPSRVKHILIANVKRRAKRLPLDSDIRAVVEDLCVQEITAQMRSLPVPYYMVLDRLGLLRTTRASAALLVAFSVSASSGLQGEEFLVRVEETWKIASA